MNFIALDNRQYVRWPGAAGDRTALRVLTVAREQMSGERPRAVNALTALLRTIDLGIHARRALTTTTIATVAGWCTRSGDATLTPAEPGPSREPPIVGG